MLKAQRTRARRPPVGPRGTTWDRVGPHGTAWDHVGPRGTMQVAGPVGPINQGNQYLWEVHQYLWEILAARGTMWDQWDHP